MELDDLDKIGASLTPHQREETARMWGMPTGPGRIALPRCMWKDLHEMRKATFYKVAPPINIGGEQYVDVIYQKGTSKIVWLKLGLQPLRLNSLTRGADGVFRFSYIGRQRRTLGGAIGWWFGSGQAQLPHGITDVMYELATTQTCNRPKLDKLAEISWS